MAENRLWDLLKQIYDKAENRTDFVLKCNNYWDGKLQKDRIAYKDQDRTAFNIVNPIVETKLNAMLDAQFTLAVVPDVASFSGLANIKNHRAVADIFNDELHNIFADNNIEKIQEKAGRYGLNCGFGLAQVLWDDDEKYGGKVSITHIKSEKLKWDPDATCIYDANYVGYDISMSPEQAKEKYGKDEEGNFDKAKCAKIDAIAEDKFSKTRDQGAIKGVTNYNNDNAGGGQLYARANSSSICAGKAVNLICLFLKDDSVYAPSKDDNSKTEEVKAEGIKKYPNGRMIIFSKNEKEKLILEDVALPKSFLNLGNIAVFNPTEWDGIAGKGEIDNLFATQDRIDGLYNKYRDSLENDFSSLFMEKDADISMDDVTQNPVTFLNKGAATPINIDNNGMAKAQAALGMIESLENHGSKMSRVNETMIYGYRQTGTTSAEQVERLQESPLSNIRAKQRNFKDFMVDIGNKCIELIQNNYTVDRLIKLSTGINNAEYAKLQINPDTDQQELVLISEAGEAIQTIKMDPDWRFKVEVIAGTEVPRSRREQAALFDNLVDRGILPLTDIDAIREYLRVQDVPNYRVIVQMIEKKQQEAVQRQQDPASHNWKEMMKNPDIAKVFADNFKALTGYPEAQQQMLMEVGLNPSPAKLDTTPVTEITRESDVAEVATMANIISNDPIVAREGYEAAIAEQITDVRR